MVKDHSDSFSTDRSAHTTAFDISVVDHWLGWRKSQSEMGPVK